MIERLLDTISPHRCSSCGENGRILCESCKENINSEPYSGCLLCHAPCGPRGICTTCRQLLPIEQAWCVGERRDSLKLLGDAYKFQSRRAGAVVLAELLDAVLPVLPETVVLLPVPTSPSTRRVRGFDHMGLIVRELAKCRQLSVRQLLERRSNATLHFLDRQARERLGPTLFTLRPNCDVPEHILVVDDIVTTGTTLRAAVSLLRHAGVKRVDVAVIARQPFEN